MLSGVLVLSACGGATGADGDADGDADSSADGGTSTVTAASATSTTAATTAADASATSGATAPDGDGGDDGPSPVNFDLGGTPDMPPPMCGGKGNVGDTDLSYIWISNSSQGTISKIDTVTMVEEGRYYAKAFNGDPSRTSVNLMGDVAVANRNGGIAKFYADTSTCPDANGNGAVETSSGGGDILPWGDDECLAWYTDLVCGSNRPVAWTRGEWNAQACTYEDIKLWTACDSQVHRIDGETGVIEDTVPVPGGNAFVYGGAADGDGNFWGLNTGQSQIFRVDGGDLSTGFWQLPPNGGYGIAVDAMGRPWVCGGGSVSRFDIPSATWDSSAGGFGGIGGCMTDGMGTMWHDGSNGLLQGFDTETLAVVNTIPLPEYVHGISIDFQGKVWGVSFAGSNAYRADPVTGNVDTFTGLVGAYTYSDMTGFALSSVGGGGVPPQ